jgi:hypothetical protein
MESLKRVAACGAVLVAALAVAQCGKGPATGPVPRTGPDEPVSRPGAGEGLAELAVSVDGWKIGGEPEVFVGDALFEMINGGAELYHQHGFVQALATHYNDVDGREIELEVFEMGDAAGAGKVFGEKAGSSGEPTDIGDDAMVESYYMNFRSGRFVVTLTGFESEPETTEGMLALARAVAAELGGRQ